MNVPADDQQVDTEMASCVESDVRLAGGKSTAKMDER